MKEFGTESKMKTNVAFGIILYMIVAVKGQDPCPYETPNKELEKCAESSYKTTNGSDAANVRKRQTDSGPDITSPDFAKWFCGGSGQEMITCADDVIEKCKDKLSSDITFNVNNAYLALRRCRDFDTSNLSGMYSCISNTSNSPDFIKCAFGSMETGEKRLGYDCLRHANVYNCYVDHSADVCGNKQVSFYIAITRMMEPAKCQDIVDAAYREPASLALTVSHSTVLTLVSVLVVLYAL